MAGGKFRAGKFRCGQDVVVAYPLVFMPRSAAPVDMFLYSTDSLKRR